MSKPTVSATGGAAPAEGLKESYEHRLELLHIVDEVNEVRYLIDAAYMAAGSLEEEECRPMQAVLDIAKVKLTSARDRLDVARSIARRAPAEDRADD